jgi:hypothetical protein
MFFDRLELDLLEDTTCRRIDLLAPGQLCELFAQRRRLDAGTEVSMAAESQDDQWIGEVARDLARSGPLTWARAVMAGYLLRTIGWNLQRWRGLTTGYDLEFRYLDVLLQSAGISPKRMERHVLPILDALTRVPTPAGTCAPMTLDQLSRSAGLSATDCKTCLAVLEKELALVQWEETEGADSDDDATGRYRLTHDFLARHVRKWLRQQRMQTGAGRVRETLRAHAGTSNPRHMPPWIDWLSIRYRTRRGAWDERERALMRRGDRHHAPRTAAFGVALALAAAWVAWLLFF